MGRISLQSKFKNLQLITIRLKSFASTRMKRRYLFGAGVFLIVLSTTGVFTRIFEGKGGERDLSLYTIQARSGSLPGLITASGELQAQRTVNVSPDRQGLLDSLYVEEGDKVIEGQVLAKMNSGDYQYRLEEVQEEYKTHKAAFERRKELFNEGAISADELDDYRNRFLTRKARLLQREVEGDELLIRAPFSGLITSRYAEPGAFVTPTTRASSSAGSTSTSIVELSQGIEVSAKVPESDIGRIRVGQKASVRVDAFPDQRFESIVDEIAPRAAKKDNVTSFEVKLLLINEPKKLRIGMTADVDFQTESTEIRTLVPTVAIVTENGRPGVLVVGKDRQPTFQEVDLGTSSGSQTSILEGVDPGELVFIDLPPWAKRKRD